jgi:hypothetical protein
MAVFFFTLWELLCCGVQLHDCGAEQGTGSLFPETEQAPGGGGGSKKASGNKWLCGRGVCKIRADRLYRDTLPPGLKHLLNVTKSMSMADDTDVSCLSDLSHLDELEECMLRRCHQMSNVFWWVEYSTGMGGTLRNAWVSHLKSLNHFFRPGGSDYITLTS